MLKYEKLWATNIRRKNGKQKVINKFGQRSKNYEENS